MARAKFVGRQSVFVWVCLVPILIYLGAFVLYPLIASVYYSSYDMAWNEFVGFANYSEALFEDPRIGEAFANTMLYAAIRIPPTIIIGFFIALALNRILFARGPMIFGFFAPYITSMVAYSAVFVYLFSSSGLFNVILQAVGLPAQPFVRSVTQALPSVALMDAFKHIGFDVIIYMAALQNIPATLYDAARVDGLTPWQTTRYITIPLIAPTLLFLVLVITVATVQVFEPVYVMTAGGPLGSTRTVVFAIWEAAFSNGRVGYAAAISVLLFLLMIVISAIQLRIGRTKWEY